MRCPHCHKDIRESMIVSAAGRINAKRRAHITSEQARAMQARSAAARRAKRDAKG